MMQRPVTFLRLRPAEAIHAVSATTRRREGTTALEAAAPDAGEVAAAHAGGVLVVAADPTAPADAWVLTPDAAESLLDAPPAGWRLTITADAADEAVLDALARTDARFLRTGRSRVAQAAAIAGLPGLAARPRVSVFADAVADAVDAVAAGAEDLLLRDWDTERLGELRDALDVALVERTALGIDVTADDARAELGADAFEAWLNLVDGSGLVRPRHGWAPGKDEEPPIPPRRLSVQWADAAWVSGADPADPTEASRPIAAVLERSLAGTPPTRDDVELLFSARGRDVEAIALAADRLRAQRVGDTVTYVVNRNINYTNLCYFRCGFCAFSKGPRSLNLRGEPYLMGLEEIVAAATEAVGRGATELTLQGGIHPDFTGNFYVDVVKALKEAHPDLHLHGFTPLEVWQGAETLGTTVPAFLEELRDAGLGSLPGTAAEILDDDVRRHLCPDKIRTAEWAWVMATAHRLGLGSTATMMFGHVDGPRSWANHLEVIRRVQAETGGFTEFVPLPFVHMGAPIWLRGRSRPGPTWDEVVLVHAVARLAFDGLIPNIQASWVKLGLGGGQRLLSAGCNDFGGTLMGEIITRSAGAAHGQEVTPAEFEDAIAAIGRVPAQRTTRYEILSGA
ncbi:MAG: 5-amino-6-(D-ribitylamino)uracil--L-tyrosine 4-hydroxyphenyl transferase CofH [Acidimicrobiia bacterium]